MPLCNENLFIHTESLPRRFPGGQEVQSLGYYPRKKEWIRRSFDTMNFSFILSGRGFYELEGGLIPVKAPAVITQAPGRKVNYGPDGEWEEFFLIYPPRYRSYFLKRRILESPHWKIRRTKELPLKILQLLSWIKNSPGGAFRNADTLDMNLESLLMASKKESRLPRETAIQVFVQQLMQKMEMDSSLKYDFHRLAEERGFSASSFRRCWEETYSQPPGQSLIEIRLRRAGRLLAETDIPVKEIAGELGYDDPLYFSRLFRKKRGESPLDYRKRTRSPYLIQQDRSR